MRVGGERNREWEQERLLMLANAIKMEKVEFRAWDKKTEQMIGVLKLDFLFESEVGIRAEGYCDCNGSLVQNHESHKHEIFPEDLSLMQFTGVLDKNGEKIFEGDIVRYPDTESEYVDVGIGVQGVKVAEQDYTPFFPIEFRDGEFGFEVKDNMVEVLENNQWYSLRRLKDEVEWIEVIGNVHENTELLPEEKA